MDRGTFHIWDDYSNVNLEIMAGGPYIHKPSGVYYITWSNSKLYPDRRRINEYLQTKKKSDALKRKFRLEELYEKRKHNPWVLKWYENPSIIQFVTDSLAAGDINKINTNHVRISLDDAAQEYISYQIHRPKGWQSELTQKVYKDDLEKFVSLLGSERYVSSITEKELHAVIFRDTVSSQNTMESDRRKLLAMWNFFKKQKWVDEVPDIETPSAQEKVAKFFYEEQFLAVCWYKICKIEKAMKSGAIREGGEHQLRFVLAWQFMAGTGLRPREACSIRLSDVYNQNILVGSNYKGKTNAQRMCPLLYESASAVDLLTNKNYRKKDPALANTDLLLGIKSDMVQKRLSSELREAFSECYPGSEKRTAYNLRDYFAVRFLSDNTQGNQDFRLIQLKNYLGHAKVATTEKYLKALPGRLDLTMHRNTDLLKLISDISRKVIK